MSPTAPPEVYGDRLFHHGRDDEFARLDALARAFHDATVARLADLGVTSGWRCLDVGAGTGNVVGWLATAVAPGQVVALDRSTSYLTAIGVPNVTVIEADAADSSVELGEFDLVHSRFTLMHLRDREQVLTRLVSLLKPGGWLVLGDSADLGTPSSPEPALRDSLRALWKVLAASIGSDIDYGRQHPRTLLRHGLTEVGIHVDTPIVAAGTPMAEFWLRTLAQAGPRMVEAGLVDAETIDAALRYLQAPDTWDVTLAGITAWGRRQSVGTDRTKQVRVE